MSDVRLYFMRHCQSQANQDGILASQIDYPLSDRGRRESLTISRAFLTDHSIDRILSSPLTRATETAEAFSVAAGLPVEVEADLIEHNMGVFGGLTYTELEARSDYMHDKTARWDWRPKRGETYSEIYDRVVGFLMRLAADPKGESILCVSHAVTLRLVRAALETSAPSYPARIADNGEIWSVCFKGVGERHKVEELHYLERGSDTARA